jgi:preprotein translocase subunit YajC
MNNAILLMGAPGQGGLSQMLAIILMIPVFYFFFIRPPMKKAKEAKVFREGLKKGDTVITIGGIHGKIIEINETTFILEAESGAKFRVEKSAVSNSPQDQLIAGVK